MVSHNSREAENTFIAYLVVGLCKKQVNGVYFQNFGI